MNDPIRYSPTKAYGQSKLANILFAQELSERLEAKKAKVYVNSLHPGVVHTEIVRYQVQWVKDIVPTLYGLFAFTSDDSSLLQVYLAISPDIPKKNIRAKYFVPMGQIAKTHEHTRNKTLQKNLWELTEKKVNQNSKVKV